MCKIDCLTKKPYLVERIRIRSQTGMQFQG
jgi:hypothetical protein